MSLYVSIRRAVIVNNQKKGRNDPPFEIRQSKNDNNPQLVHDMEFEGRIRLVYDPAEPLISGAVAWLEIG